MRSTGFHRLATAVLVSIATSATYAPAAAQSADGWRVQVFATDESVAVQGEASKLRTALSGRHPVYIVEEAGFFKLRFGDFVQKEAALVAREEAQSWGYDEAWIPVSPVTAIYASTRAVPRSWPDHEGITFLHAEDFALGEDGESAPARKGAAGPVDPVTLQPLEADLPGLPTGAGVPLSREEARSRTEEVQRKGVVGNHVAPSRGPAASHDAISIDGHLSEDRWINTVFLDITSLHDPGTHVGYLLDGGHLLVGVQAQYAPRFTLRTELIRNDPPEIAEGVTVQVSRPGMDEPLVYGITIQGTLTRPAGSGAVSGTVAATSDGWQAELMIELPPESELPREGLRVRIERANPPM